MIMMDISRSSSVFYMGKKHGIFPWGDLILITSSGWKNMDGFSERNIDIGKPHGFWSETRRILASPSRHLSWSVVLFESSVVSASLMCSLCETREVINRVRLRTNGTLEIFLGKCRSMDWFSRENLQESPILNGKIYGKTGSDFPN